jgi:hypothetical protein
LVSDIEARNPMRDAKGADGMRLAPAGMALLAFCFRTDV